jgi:hypothetical protein
MPSKVCRGQALGGPSCMLEIMHLIEELEEEATRSEDVG